MGTAYVFNKKVRIPQGIKKIIFLNIYIYNVEEMCNLNHLSGRGQGWRQHSYPCPLLIRRGKIRHYDNRMFHCLPCATLVMQPHKCVCVCVSSFILIQTQLDQSHIQAYIKYQCRGIVSHQPVRATMFTSKLKSSINISISHSNKCF